MAGSEPSIHRQHRQRLKKRFLTEGLDHFDSVNLLELTLFYAIPQGDTNPIAHRLLDTFGSLSGVMNASYERLVQVDGWGSMLPPFSSSFRRCAAAIWTIATPLATLCWTPRPLSDT